MEWEQFLPHGLDKGSALKFHECYWVQWETPEEN